MYTENFIILANLGMSSVNCRNCLLDSSLPGFSVDSEGVCNYCNSYESYVRRKLPKNSLNTLVEEIRKSSRNSKYDCVVALSGGVDSCYMLYYAKEVLNLRVIAVHVDNGWNRAQTVDNMYNVLEKLNVDFHTIVLDWNGYSKLQKAVLLCNVPDIEVPTDHIVNASLYKFALSIGVKYLFHGMTSKTESIPIPQWSYGHSDWYYLSSLYKSVYSDNDYNKLPHYSLFGIFNLLFVKKLKVINFLNYIEYRKSDAQEVLVNRFSFNPYEGKHNESAVTRFVQEYILPKKFGILKRKVHLSNSIQAGEISRTEALEELNKSIHITEMEITHFCKKMGFTREEFNEYINNGINKNFRDYRSMYRLTVFLKKVKDVIYRN